MVRRVSLCILLLALSASSLQAARSRCDREGDCLPQHPPPEFGPGANPPIPPGGGSPIFNLRDQEPYRNPDMGPLGVVLSTGELQFTVTDMEIPGRGFPFRLSRTYRSKKDGERSVLGHNWSLNYDEYLTPGVFSTGGTAYPAIQWKLGNGWTDVWVDHLNGLGYRAFQGFFGKLRALGPKQGYQIRYADGTVKTFGKQVLDLEGHLIWVLTRIEDRNGNFLTLQISPAGTISSITDTLGRAVTFAYGGDGRLAAVTDFHGRSIAYGYDARGDLVTVRSPVVTGTPNGNDFPLGKTTTYRYLGAEGCTEEALRHNLRSITDAKGQTFLRNTYTSEDDPACGNPGLPVDTVDYQEYGGGAPAPRITYDYAPIPAGADPDAGVVTTQTTVLDRNGNQQVHRFNPQGNPLTIEVRTNRGIRSFSGGADEPDYVVRNTYVIDEKGNQPMLVSRRTSSGGITVDAGGRLVSYEQGVTEEYVYYDQQGLAANPDVFRKGNVERIIRSAGSRGAPAGQEQLVTQFAYEPLFNQPVLVTDPRGHVTHLTYDYQEGSYSDLLSQAPPPAIDPGWWSNGEIQSFMDVPGNSGRGDLNGDGYHRGGNAILVSRGMALAPDGSSSGEIATTTAYNGFGLPTIVRDPELNETHYLYFAERNPDGDALLTSLPTPDGRSLSSQTGAGGGGYLQQKVMDATPTMPLPSPPPLVGRDSGQNPAPRNVSLRFTYDPVGNLKSTTDGRGIRTDYSLNALNQILRTVHAATGSADGAGPLSYVEEFRYDANNNLVQHRSEQRDDLAQAPPAPGAHRWVTKDLAYDDLDRRIAEIITTQDSPAIALTTTYAYDGNGNLRKTVSPLGSAVLRFYDERDLLFREVALKRPSHDLLEMSYDPAVDSVIQFDYDGSGGVIQITDAEGHVARSGYDGYGRKVVGFDPAYQKTTYTYDAGGILLSESSYGALGGATPNPDEPPAVDYPKLGEQRFFHDELGRLRRTDSRFFRYAGEAFTPLSTDSNAALTAVPAGDPLPAAGDGWTTSLDFYDRLGRAVRTVNDNGHAVETRYDGMSRKIKILMNVAFPFTFDPADPPSRRNARDYGHDANGNVIEVIETEYGAERTGVSPRLLPPQQHRSTFKYDSLNRQVESKLVGRVGAAPVNLTSTAVYDSRGNTIQATDSAGGRTKSYYDGLNRLTRTEAGFHWNGTSEGIPSSMFNSANADGKVTTTYAYDADGRLISIRDDGNRLTRYAHDSLGRQTRVTYPDSSFRQVTYDRDSLSIGWEQVGVQGYRIAASTRYDALHRPTHKDVENSRAPFFIGTMQQRFEYDGRGRVTRAVDDSNLLDGFTDSEVVLAYNSQGKIITETQSFSDVDSGIRRSGTNTVESVYDGVGFRTEVLYPSFSEANPERRKIVHTPDELNRVRDICDSFHADCDSGSPNPAARFRYDFLGPSRLLNRFAPNGTKLTMLSGPADELGAGYDSARRLVDYSNKLTSSGADLARYAYGYDNAGNRRFERRLHQPSGGSWKGETYGYDAVYRLVQRQEGNLDASGALVGPPNTTQEFTLDGLGNWRAHKQDAATYSQTVNSLNQYSVFNGPSGPRKLSYDFAGNLISESLSPDENLQYAYDFMNRLVTAMDAWNGLATYRYDALGRRISKTRSDLSQTRFIYDGDRLIEERDGTNALEASYLYGPAPDEVLTRRRWSGGISSDIFYHTNALGSVTALTSSTGLVIERYAYDAYGQVTFLSPSFTPLTSSAVANPILFTGRYYDTESGLYYHRARTYHPQLGRFLQRDPLGEAAGLNLYNYVFNNPVNDTDPSGLLSGWLAEEYARTRGATERMYRERLAGDAEAERQAEEAMRQLSGYTAMEDSFQAGIDARKAAHWEEWYDERQQERNAELKSEIQASLQDPQNMKNMENPKGVAVIIYGLGQNAAEEHGGLSDHTQLDDKAKKLKDQGYVVIEVNADTLAQAGKFNEASDSGTKILSDAVMAVSGAGSMPVEIDAFSRGAGGAVKLANQMTGSGMEPGRLTVNLTDPFMGPTSHTINDARVRVNVSRTSGFHWQNLGLSIAAGIAGFVRDVSLGPLGRTSPVRPTLYDVKHSEMDYLQPVGALAP